MKKENKYIKPEIILKTNETEVEKLPEDDFNYEPISSAPRNGTIIFISETGKDKGEAAFWKKTRAFANATHRWEETGFFVHNITNLPVSFKPAFWRMRNMYEI